MFYQLSTNNSDSCNGTRYCFLKGDFYKTYFLRLFFAMFLVFSINFKAYSNEAENFVNSISNRALGIISSTSSNSAIHSELSALFENAVNITWITKFILGKYYRQFSPQEFGEFQVLYKRYLMHKYIPKFKQFAGYESVINYSKPLGQNYYLVQTKIFDPSKAKPLTVEYRVKKASNDKFYIHDITVDAISLILTHRSDFTNFLHTSSIEDLLHNLENQNL